MPPLSSHPCPSPSYDPPLHQVILAPPMVVDDDVTVEEDIWDLTERQAIGSRVMCESVAEREYEGNITDFLDLWRY